MSLSVAEVAEMDRLWNAEKAAERAMRIATAWDGPFPFELARQWRLVRQARHDGWARIMAEMRLTQERGR